MLSHVASHNFHEFQSLSSSPCGAHLWVLPRGLSVGPREDRFSGNLWKSLLEAMVSLPSENFPLEAGSQVKVTHDTGRSSCNHTRREHTVLRLPDSPPFPSSPIPPLRASGVSEAAEVPDNPSSASKQTLDQFSGIITNRKTNSKTRRQMSSTYFLWVGMSAFFGSMLGFRILQNSVQGQSALHSVVSI